MTGAWIQEYLSCPAGAENISLANASRPPIAGPDLHHHADSLPAAPAGAQHDTRGLHARASEGVAMTHSDARYQTAYRITYITLDDVQLHFETEIAIADGDGGLTLQQSATPPGERRALRELIQAQGQTPF